VISDVGVISDIEVLGTVTLLKVPKVVRCRGLWRSHYLGTSTSTVYYHSKADNGMVLNNQTCPPLTVIRKSEHVQLSAIKKKSKNNSSSNFTGNPFS